jgi:hypothetical protein
LTLSWAGASLSWAQLIGVEERTMDGDPMNKQPRPLDSASVDEQLEADFDRALSEVSGAEARLRRKALEFETELLESIRLLDGVVKQLKTSLRLSTSDSHVISMEELHRITHPIHLYRLEVAQLVRGCPPVTRALRGIANKALGTSATRPRERRRKRQPA